MRQTHNSLHELVHRMGKSEKRYFRLFTQQQGGGGQNYLHLFDELLKMECYDEDELRTRMAKLGLYKNLKATKKYLYDNILKCLKLYFVDYCISVKLPDALQNMRVLLNKGMFEDAARAYRKIEDVYTTNEQFGGLFDVLTFGERLWRTILPGSEAAPKLRGIYQQKQLCLQYLNNLNEFVFLKNEIELVFQDAFNGREPERTDRLIAFAGHHLLTHPGLAMSIRARMEHFECLCLIHYGSSDWEALADASHEALSMIEGQSLDQYFVLNWRTTMHRFACLAALRRDDEARFEQCAEAMERYLAEWSPRVNLLDSMAGRFRFLLVRLNRHFQNLDYAKFIGLFLENEEFVLENWKYFDNTLRGELALLLAQVYAYRQDYRAALDWTHRITRHERDYALTAQIGWARMLEVWLHLRDDNYALAVSLVRSTQRFLQKSGDLLPTERLLLRYLNKIAKDQGVDQEKYWNELRARLDPLAEMDSHLLYRDGLRVDRLLRTVGKTRCRRAEQERKVVRGN